MPETTILVLSKANACSALVIVEHLHFVIVQISIYVLSWRQGLQHLKNLFGLCEVFDVSVGKCLLPKVKPFVRLKNNLLCPTFALSQMISLFLLLSDNLVFKSNAMFVEYGFLLVLY